MRLSLFARASLLVGTAAGVPALFACLQHPLKPVEYDGAQELQKGIQLTVNKDVDILFVIDNSGSMGEEQANLSANFPAFIDVLEAEDVKANYRIGVTTTDNGNPYCQTGPEAGKLQMSSCLQRQGEFIFTGTPAADVTAIACTDNCTVMDMNIQGSTTELDPTEQVRPWLENIEGKTNLPDTDGDGTPDYDTTQAFQCFGPQGIAGCGFESHLESMYKAFLRAENDEEAQYGFLRAAAILSIVIVTDEVDCSYNNAWQSIFYGPDQDGLQAFWEDPATQTSPSSALCWNAGVACTGGPGTYDECHSENYAEDGTPGADAGDAVLHPLSRYTDFVQELEDRKGEYVPDAEVLVALIGGVPIGYETGMSELTYQDATGAEQLDFGIAAGCVNNAVDPPATARPPVREREFAEAFQIGSDRNVFSICATDFSPALGSIANAIRDQLKPACMPACVADTNPVTEILDPTCNLIQEAPKAGGGIQETNIPACGAGDTVPDGSDVCFVALVDGTGETADMSDDLSDDCLMEGWNLEFRLVRREGVPAPGGTSVKATCQLSTQKEIDCPDL